MRGLSRSVILAGFSTVLAIACAPATAQQPPPAMPAPEGAATTQEVRAASQTRPASTQSSFNFDNAPIAAVLEYLSDTFGYIVVRDQGVTVTGRIGVLSKQPVTPAEVLTVLNTVLKDSTPPLAALQVDRRTIKITTVDLAKKGAIPVYFGADPAAIEPSDNLRTQVIPLRNLDAPKLKLDLASLVSANADLSANAASNSLVMTDTSANVHRIVEIVSAMDKRDAMENSIKVKQLKYADAMAAAKLITDIFKTDQQTGGNQAPSPAAFFRAAFGRGGGGGGGPGADQPDKGQTGKVVASADERTNTVVVSGPSDTLKVIDQVLDQLDADPSAEQNFFIYAVKNGQAADMAATLNSLFTLSSTGTNANKTGTSLGSIGSSTSSLSSGNTGLGGGGLGGNRSGGLGGSGLGGGGLGGGALGGGGTGGTGSPFGQTGTSGSTANSGYRPGGTGAPGQGTSQGGPASGIAAMIGQVYVVADVDTNSLLVASAAKFQDRVKEIILQLDRPVAQVLIKVLIAEVTHDNSTDQGVDFSVINNSNGIAFNTNLGNALAPGTTAVLGNGLLGTVTEGNISATLHALATVNKLDVLSRPYILASDNQPAQITVGQVVPIITGSEVNDVGTVTNDITYTQVGILLSVTPHVNQEGLVTLLVAPQVSELTAQTVNTGPGVQSPIFNLRSAQTQVAIKDGNTIVIGGMMQDQSTVTITKIPILGDLPWVGPVFQRAQTDKTKTELLIFLTPHVALKAERLKPMSAEEIGSLKLTPHAVDPGVFQQHMAGMELGGTETLPGATTAPTTRAAGGVPATLPSTRPATQPARMEH